MGTIVSQSREREERNCPSAVLAAKAKIRQDLLKAHLNQINTKGNVKTKERNDPGEVMPEWFPPGIHYSCQSEKDDKSAQFIFRDQQMEWMTDKEVTSRDLHKAMFNMSKKEKHYYMRLVQVTPLHPSELNIRSDFHSRLILSEPSEQTIRYSKNSRSNLSNVTAGQVTSISEAQEGTVPLDNYSSNGGHFEDDSDVVKLKTSDKRDVRSPVMVLKRRLSSSNSMTDKKENTEGHIQNDITDEFMQPESLTTAQKNHEDDNTEEEKTARGETKYIGEVNEDKEEGILEETHSTIQFQLDTGRTPQDTFDHQLKAQVEQNKQVILERLEMNRDINIGKITNEVPGYNFDAKKEQNNVNFSKADKHECNAPTGAIPNTNNGRERRQMFNNSPKADTNAVKFVGKLDKAAVRTVNSKQPSTRRPSKVVTNTLQFPLEGPHPSNKRMGVKVFPFTPIEQKPSYDNTTQYRVSFGGNKAKMTQGSISSAYGGQGRGLHGWNLPPHLVKHRMETLDHYRDRALSFTKYSPRDKRDSITSLIEKYQKVKTPKTSAEEEKNPSIGIKLKETRKKEHIKKKLQELEKMKSYGGKSLVTRRPQQKMIYSRKSYEMNLWLNHVRFQEQQMMQMNQAEDQIRTPGTLHNFYGSSKGSGNRGDFGYRPNNTFEGYYDSQGLPMCDVDLQQCPTVPECVVEIEGTPLEWLSGKGCGEWQPLLTSKAYNNRSSQKLNETCKNLETEGGLVKQDKVDSLVQLLYDEVAEGTDENINRDEEQLVEPSKENMEVAEENIEDSGDDVAQVANRKPPQGIASTVKVVMAANKFAKKVKKENTNTDSILMKKLDDDAIRKASEFRGGVIRQLTNLTDAIQMEYHRFITDVDYTNFYAARQIEALQTRDCPPKTVLLISSTVPKCEQLKAAVLPGVLVHIYNYHSDNLEDLLKAVSLMLDNAKKGVKAKYVGIVCKGGPGYFYLIKKVPVTTARIRSHAELLEFWQSMGHHMSKLVPGQSVIHLMESNVAGNKKGEQLLEDLTSALLAHRIGVESPLELAPSGRKMLELYFNLEAHREWKEQRYKV